METLKVDTLNVIDIMSMTDEESERERHTHHIDINQEIVIPNIEPMSLFSDDDDDQELDSEGNKTPSKWNRQRPSLNQTKTKDSDMLLMETSLTIMDDPPMSPPPFSPPPLPLSPNIVSTTFSREVGFLSLPLTSTTASSSDHQKKHHRHHHKHHHKHRHSTAVGRTAPIDERGHFRSSHQPPETEIVLSPSKLGQ